MKAPLAALAIALAASAGIAVVQPSLHLAKVKLGTDVTALPPAEHLKTIAIGYRAATADILWADLLVTYGTHASEHRAIEGLTRYVDGIVALDPGHPSVYEFLDTLLVVAKNGGTATPEDVRLVRSYFERGTRDRPYDAKLWLQCGQFLAFIAPSFLVDEREKETYRRDGALAITRAVDLGVDADRSLAATSILSKAGETKAAIRQLEHAYALSDNPETRKQISLKLQRLQATTDTEDAVAKVESDWRTNFPFLSRNAALLVGPSRDPLRCAGPVTSRDPRCARDWSSAVAR